VSPCAFCGRDNDAASRYCIDCGKPLVPSAARVPAPSSPQAIVPTPYPAAGPTARAGAVGGPSARLVVPPTRVTPTAAADDPTGAMARGSARSEGAGSCLHCGARVDAALPFCPWCGKRTGHTGATVTGEAGTVVFSASAGAGPRLSLLDDAGNPTRSFVIDSGDLTVGRAAGDVVFADDDFLSPIHAQFSFRGGRLVVRDLGSRNGSWVFLDAPQRLADGDVLLVGSQLLRFRRLGYPGPRLAEADQTRRMGSFTPSADVAVLQQLRADGSTRDVFHLSPGRAVLMGRAEGDWVFPYDKTMSARHAEVRSEDAEFVVLDCGSRNGVGLAVRGDRPLRAGQRVLLGDHTLRVDSL
jgi:pSer/pThr/pTyr-binding forkhead associated (FHA) protein